MSNRNEGRRAAYHREPCHGCRYHAVCASQQMACVVYARWIGSMHSILQRFSDWPAAPRPEIYAVLFPKEENDETEGSL